MRKDLIFKACHHNKIKREGQKKCLLEKEEEKC